MTVNHRFGLPLEEIAKLDVDEVARLVVAYLRARAGAGAAPHVGNTLNDVRIEANEQQVPPDVERAAAIRLAGAWQWLRNHFVLVPSPEHGAPWELLTPAADDLDVPGYILDLRASDLLGGLTLDPALANVVTREFRRGSYGLAALAAMRLVEDRVRRTAKLARRDVGTDLMHKAFNPTGPLADPALLDSENQGRASLFAGAMGAIKNEHSHHDVVIKDPQRALELVVFANLLLRVVDDARRASEARLRQGSRRGPG